MSNGLFLICLLLLELTLLKWIFLHSPITRTHTNGIGDELYFVELEKFKLSLYGSVNQFVKIWNSFILHVKSIALQAADLGTKVVTILIYLYFILLFVFIMMFETFLVVYLCIIGCLFFLYLIKLTNNSSYLKDKTTLIVIAFQKPLQKQFVCPFSGLPRLGLHLHWVFLYLQWIKWQSRTKMGSVTFINPHRIISWPCIFRVSQVIALFFCFVLLLLLLFWFNLIVLIDPILRRQLFSVQKLW